MIENMLDEIKQRCPVIEKALNESADLTLNQYVANIRIKETKSFQDNKDFLSLAYEYCEPLLGKEATKEIVETLKFPLLATANHHGADFSPQTMQGNWLYWKILLGKGLKLSYLPICAFGMVSLRNSSYARGLMIHTLGSGRIRLPIFPKNIENKMVRYTDAFNAENVQRAINTVKKEYSKLSSKDVILNVLEEIFLDKDVLECNRYGDQATLINQKLAQKSFKKSDFPELIYIETEQIINKLMVVDLENNNSLLTTLLCNKKVLTQLNETLYSGIPLSQLIFWGVDESGRRFPIKLMSNGELIGKNLKQEEIKMKAGRAELIELLKDEQVVPGGYAIAIMLCFARGYMWMGGCFQGEYLPIWQRLTAECLAKTGYEAESESIRQYDCTGYVCGPIFALSKTDDEMLNPAGFIELIKDNGISKAKLENLMYSTIYESHEMGLMEFYGDLIPSAERTQDWSGIIASGLKEKYEKYVVL